MNRAAFFASIRKSEFAGALTQSQVDGFSAILDAAPSAWDDHWLAYVLATVIWETNLQMQPVREAYWLPEAWRKAHLRYYPFYGRGFVQITWRDNYAKFSPIVGVDLVAHPDQALEPTISAKILIYGMEHGTFTGRKLADYFNAQKTDWTGARWIINAQDQAEHIGHIAQQCYAALTAS